jgi:hypothetical protein
MSFGHKFLDDELTFDIGKQKLDTNRRKSVARPRNKSTLFTPKKEEQKLKIPDVPEIELPKLETPSFNLDPKLNLEPEVAVLPLDLSGPALPLINLELPNPDFNAAIDTAQKFIDPVRDITSDIVDPIVDVVSDVGESVIDTSKEIVKIIDEPVETLTSTVKKGVDVLAEGTRPVADVLAGVTAPVAEVINRSIDAVADVLGETPKFFKDATIKRGDGSGYGEVEIGDGVVLDAAPQLDKTYESVVQGTPLEGTNGNEVFTLITDPAKFIEEKSVDVALDLFDKISPGASNRLGLDKGTLGDVFSLIGQATAATNKAERDRIATNFISKEIVTRLGIDKKALGGLGGDPLTSGIAELIGGGNLNDAAESMVKRIGSDLVVDTVSNFANTIVPGSGFIIKTIADIFNYSCYLSTIAYHHNFISKRDYFLFTHYRMKIQSKEKDSRKVWAGYILICEEYYTYFLNNKRHARWLFKIIIEPWLNHCKYKLGKGKFTFSGWLVTSLSKLYFKKVYNRDKFRAEKRLKMIGKESIMDVYKQIVKVVERRRSYA